MRPIERRDWPRNSEGFEIKYKYYTKARGELISRLGEYCSYCEMHLDASLAVEHVQPKKPDNAVEIATDRELDWNNFLLACANCNSTKSNTNADLDNYFWPDKDNTFRVLKYSEGGIVEPAEELSDHKSRAESTIKLTGLDKNPSNDPKASDRRWQNRRETWEIAVRSKSRLLQFNRNEMREQIVVTATGHAYWSVWMTVFREDPDMLRRFIEAFPGTCHECFDNNNQYEPIPRRGDQF